MVNATVTAGTWAPLITLVPNEISTITFTDEDLVSVEVISDDVAPVRWTCDGTTPSATAGWYIPTLGVDERQPPTAFGTIVKLWSAGAPTVQVQRGG